MSKSADITKGSVEELKEALRIAEERAGELVISLDDDTAETAEVSDGNHPAHHKGDKDTLHLDMLRFVLDSSKKLSTAIDQSEKKKSEWRDSFMKVLVWLLLSSLLFAGIMTVLYGIGKVEFPIELVIGLFGTIIAQIISLLVLFIKFVNDVQYIEMFKTVTYKLLEYLTKEYSDKNI